MSVSNRFRDISKEVSAFLVDLPKQDETVRKGAKEVKKAKKDLQEWVELVGEVPRMSLEFKLTPILLKVYNHLDQARLAFEEDDLDDLSDTAWELQQKIYRLLNDL
jgi:SPX domain protein involved in polyphosphate accumulation